MDNHSQTGTYLESLAKLAGATGAVSLTGSLVYDWGFFSALGISFLDAPTSISDHARSALLWFPKIATAGLSALFYELLMQRIEGGRSEEELIANASNPALTRKLREGAPKLVLAALMLSLVGYMLAGEWFASSLPYAVAISWLVFAVWAQSPTPIVQRRSRVARMAIAVLPALVSYLYFTGRNDAAALYQPTAPQTRASLADGSTRSITLLRYLDRGILLREASGTVALLPWAEIKGLRGPGQFTPSTGLLCLVTKAACIVPGTRSASAPQGAASGTKPGP